MAEPSLSSSHPNADSPKDTKKRKTTTTASPDKTKEKRESSTPPRQNSGGDKKAQLRRAVTQTDTNKSRDSQPPPQGGLSPIKEGKPEPLSASSSSPLSSYSSPRIVERRTTKASITMVTPEIKKPEVPMYVSDSWLSKWQGRSTDSQGWNFGYKKEPRPEFYLPLELGVPMELLIYQTSTNEFGPIPVFLVCNGHVLRIFQGSQQSHEQTLIITFNLREICTAMSPANTGERQQLFVVSRFHGRIFILQHPHDNKTPMEDLYSLIQINMHWARKFTTITYPQEIAESLWPEAYITQQNLPQTKSLGWGIVGKDQVFVKKEDDGQLGLYKTEEETRPKTKIKYTPDVNVTALIKTKGVSFTFDEKKKTIQMLDIAGFERVLLLVAGANLVKPKYEAKLLKMISNYTKIPQKFEYKLHPQLYQLKEVDPGGTAARAPRQSVMVPPGFGLSGKSDEMISTVLDIVESVNRVEERIDKIQSLQEQIADVIDLEATRVGAIEQKLVELEGLKESQVDYFEAIDEVMIKIENLDTKVKKSCYTGVGGIDLDTEISDMKTRMQALEETLGDIPMDSNVHLSLTKLEGQVKDLHTRPKVGTSNHSSVSSEISMATINDFDDRISRLESKITHQPSQPTKGGADARLDALERQIQTLQRLVERQQSNDRVVALEKRLSALEVGHLTGAPSKASSGDSHGLEVSTESFTRVVNRLLAAEKKLKKQEEMESTIETLTTKVTTLATVCQKLAAQIKSSS